MKKAIFTNGSWNLFPGQLRSVFLYLLLTRKRPPHIRAALFLLNKSICPHRVFLTKHATQLKPLKNYIFNIRCTKRTIKETGYVVWGKRGHICKWETLSNDFSQYVFFCYFFYIVLLMRCRPWLIYFIRFTASPLQAVAHYGKPT